MGKKGHAKLHIKCPRCGRNSFHKKKKKCSHCGYGKSKRIRKYKWNKKHYFKKFNNAKGFRRKTVRKVKIKKKTLGKKKG